MYICIYDGVMEPAVREEVFGSARSVDEVRRNTGWSTQCGKCLLMAQHLVEDARLRSTSETSGAAAGAPFSA